VYESTAYSCTRTALYSFTITGRPFVYNYSTVLVQRCIIVQYEGNFEGKEHKTLESTCTRSPTKVQLLSYFQKYFRTKVRKYFQSTFVRKYFRKYFRTKVSYEGTKVRRYFRTIIFAGTKVLSYLRTTVYSVQLYTYVVVVLPEVNINVLYVYVYCRICVL